MTRVHAGSRRLLSATLAASVALSPLGALAQTRGASAPAPPAAPAQLGGLLAQPLGTEALLEHGARDIAFLGTAGALGRRFQVGDLVVPEALAAPGGGEPLDRLEPVAGARRAGGYLRVKTPNIETAAWARDAAARGVDLVEVELGHSLALFKGREGVRFRAGLVVSDVLTGDARRDMTEWGLKDLRALMPKLGAVLDDLLGLRGRRAWRVRAYKTVPLVTPDSEG